MPSLFPIQDAMQRGELSPRLHARASIDLYRAGLSRCENFLTLPHGGIRKRGGTYFVAEVPDSTKITRPIPFIFSDDQAYCLILGHLKMRIYAYGARVGTVELTTPWASTEVYELMFVGSKDQMWITHPDHKTQVLTRTAHTTWALADFDPNDGPYDAVNADETHQMYVSAVSGAGITITADFDIFQTSDVGRLVRIDMESFRTIKPWEPGAFVYNQATATEVLPICRYNGNVYDLDFTPAGGVNYFTGGTPPTHLKGTEWDGPSTATTPTALGGVAWTYLHSGFGVARITARTDLRNVTATVLSRFPAELVAVGNKSFVWRFGALHTADYAQALSLFEERMALGVGTAVYASKSFAVDFAQFKPGPDANDALQFLMVGDDIAWLKDVEGVLALGTISGVQALSGSGLDVALTPGSFKKRKSQTATCAPIMPAEVDDGLIYVTKSRKSLAKLSLTNIGRFTSEDIGQVSEHIPKKGIVELASQHYPDPYLWFPVQTGELGALTYQPSQEVRGMHRHKLGGATGSTAYGVVEGACITPGQTGQDDLWLIVRRTIGGSTKRYLEIMTAAFEYQNLVDAFQVDCGLSYSGVAVNAVTGLDHLVGSTVDVLADGRVYTGLSIVVDVFLMTATVTLPGGATAAKWHVGLPMPAYADTLELDVGGKDGSIRGRRKKVTHVILSLFETDRTGLEISSLIKGRWELAKIPTNLATNNTVPSLFTGNVTVPVDDSWEGQGRISLRHTAPTPCTVLAILPQFESEP